MRLGWKEKCFALFADEATTSFPQGVCDAGVAETILKLPKMIFRM